MGKLCDRALYRTMNDQLQYMQYTQLGVKYIDEDLSEIFLLKMGGVIENAGYDACLQRNVSNLRIKGDHTTNPELFDTYELAYAEPVGPGKPAPDVIIDFNKAAEICGLGAAGDAGHLIAPGMGPFVRMAFIVTDAPLECDAPFGATLCDHCGKCKEACPGKAISEAGVNTWQCAAYYRGANRSRNPFMPSNAYPDEPDRLKIMAGELQLSPEHARKILEQTTFYPMIRHGMVSGICGRACDTACYIHLEEKGVLKRKFKNPFRKRPEWKLPEE